VFYARPHLCPLPSVFAALRRDRAKAKGDGGRGEDFGNHGLGDLIDCPANPGARIFKGTANDSPSPWGEGRVEGGRGSNPSSMNSEGTFTSVEHYFFDYFLCESNLAEKTNFQ